MNMIFYTRVDLPTGNFPQEEIAECAKGLLETVSRYEPNYFKVLRDELQAKVAQETEPSNRSLLHRLIELNREEPLFGRSPVVKICGVTNKGINVEFTIGQKIILAKLMDRDPIDEAAASCVIPDFKTLISSLVPSATFADVTA